MNKILITTSRVSLPAIIYDSPTSRAIWDALPIVTSVNTWGDEIYFDIKLKIPLESDAHAQVAVGELGYWPMGRAFCIFFGPTPISSDNQPVAASPVNIFGRVEGDATQFKSVRDSEELAITRLEPAD